MTLAIAEPHFRVSPAVLRACVSVATALAPVSLLLVWHWHLLPPISATDYAQYILHAKALVEGRPYTDTGYLFTQFAPFIGPRALPPGLPLTLAPFVAIGGVNSPLLRLVPIASQLALLIVVWRYFSRSHSPAAGWAAAAMTGVSLEAGYTSTAPISEPGFCALLWGLLLVVDGAQDRWGARRAVAVTLLGFGAMAYRVAGVALVPAVGLWALLHWRRVGPWAFAPVVAWCTAAGAVVLAGSLRLVGPADMNALTFDILWRRLISRSETYKLAVFESHLYPFASDAANDVYHLVTALLMVVGTVVFLRSRWRSLLSLFALSYMAMLLAVPVADGRYLWPLFPLSAALLAMGARAVIGWARPAPAAFAERGAIAVVAVATLATCVRLIQRPEPPSLLGRPDVVALFEHIGSQADVTSHRYVFVNPRVLSLETGAKAMGLFAAPSEEIALRELEEQGITHVVLGSLGIDERQNRFLSALVAGQPARFRLEYTSGPFQVYRVLDAARNGES
ncbi:MAG TPA: hypothetical protein VF178_12865 [Gemmatimonadaceae bacterium]